MQRWERKYRLLITQDPPGPPQVLRRKADDPAYLAFARELVRLQQTHERLLPKSPPADPAQEISLPEVLQLVERLYQQLARSEAEARAKGRAA